MRTSARRRRSAAWACRCRTAPRRRRCSGLSEAIAASGARRVVFLGDLLHSAHAHAPATLQALAQWRKQHAALELLLVRGNHDHHAGDPPAALGMHGRRRAAAHRRTGAVPPPAAARRRLCAGRPPAPWRVLGGRANDRLRLPCFHFGEHVGVLPAFGAFTGMHALRPAARRARLRGRRRGGCRAAAYTARHESSPLESPDATRRITAGALEAVLPHPLTAPDWTASIAFRYRKRAGSGLHRAGAPRGADPPARAGRGRTAEAAPAAQHRAVRRRPWRQQRAADRRARHRQELADQGLPERICAARPAPDRGRQGRPGGPARHRRPGGRTARAFHRLLRRPELRRGRAGLQGAEVDPRRLGVAGLATTC